MANKPGEANFFPDVPTYPEIGTFQPIYGKFDLTTYIQGASDYEIMAFLVGKYNATLEAYGTATKLSTETIEAAHQLQDWINNWFDNLDVQQELNNKIDSMVADGTFSTLLHQTFDAQINQQTTNAVTAWLVANVTPTGSAVVVDKSLTIEGAAADAKIVGDNFNQNTLNLLAFLNNTNNIFNSLNFTNETVFGYNGDSITNINWNLSNPVSTLNFKYISTRLIQNITVSPIVFFTKEMKIAHIVQRNEFYKIDDDNLGSCYGFIDIPQNAYYVKFATYTDYKDPGMIKFYKTIPNNIIVSNDNKGDVFTINEVMNLHKDGDNINITLFPGVYEEVVHFENKYNSVIIKGTSRDECTIIDQSGVYKNSTLVVMGNFLLENLTLKATIDKAGSWVPTYDENDVNNTFPSYALHIDGRSLNPEGYAYGTINNCLVYSTSFPSVGMGTNKNQIITFNNCEFVRVCTNDNYKKDNWPGAFLCHNSTDTDYYLNQKLIIHNCSFNTNYGFAAYIRANLLNNETSYNFTFEAINNQFISSDYGMANLCKYDKGASILSLLSSNNNSANINAYQNSKIGHYYSNIFKLPLNFTEGSLQNNVISPSIGWRVTPYLSISEGEKLDYYANTVGGIVQLFVFYDENLNVVSDYTNSEPSWSNGTYTVPTGLGIKYVRASINISDNDTYFVSGNFNIE